MCFFFSFLQGNFPRLSNLYIDICSLSSEFVLSLFSSVHFLRYLGSSPVEMGHYWNNSSRVTAEG